MAECVCCNKYVYKPSTVFIEADKIYCSKDCEITHFARTTTWNMPCSNCGGVIDGTLHGWGKRFFCSDDCLNEFRLKINNKKDE